MELRTRCSSRSVEQDVAGVVGKRVELFESAALVVHVHPILASSEGEGRA